MLEKDVERKVVEWARRNGCLSYKFTSPNRRSVPDRLFILPGGAVVFIEFKAPGKKPTDAQQREMEKLARKGATVRWFDNAASAISFLENFLE